MTAVAPSRRDLMIGACAAAAWPNRAPATPSGAAAPGAASPEALLLALCAGLRCPPGVRRACRDALPAGAASRRGLAQLILADLAAAGRGCSSPAALRAALRDQSRADFGSGRIVTIDGWMLSRTEQRLYALAALLA